MIRVLNGLLRAQSGQSRVLGLDPACMERKSDDAAGF